MPGILTIAIPVAVVIAVILIVLFGFVKTAKGNEALVISGLGATDKNGNPKIIRAGGSIVWPGLQRYDRFDCCIRTADVEGDVTKTVSGVPIRLDWAVAYGPDVYTEGSCRKPSQTSSTKTRTNFVRLFWISCPAAYVRLSPA